MQVPACVCVCKLSLSLSFVTGHRSELLVTMLAFPAHESQTDHTPHHKLAPYSTDHCFPPHAHSQMFSEPVEMF